MDFAHILILLLLPILSSLVFLKHKKNRQGVVHNLPPSPTKLPVLGHLHLLGTLPHISLRLLSQKHGPLMYLQLGSVTTVVVSTAGMAKEVLKTHDLSCCDRPSLIASDRYTYGQLDVSFAPYGEYWRDMRKIYILELFSSKRIESFRFVREEEVSLMLQRISESSSLHVPVNLSKFLVNLASNIICRVALGRSFSGEGYGESKFHKLLTEEEALITGFCFGDYFPALGWLDTVTGKLSKINKNLVEFDAFYEEIIEQHLDPERVKTDQEDLVDVLLKLQNQANLTRAHIKAVIGDMFIAGTETSSTILNWAMTELMRNQDAMRKAQNEVRSFMRTKGKVEETYIMQLSYLKCIIKETMRLHAPVPLLLPRVTINHVKINEYDIPPKTRLIINAWAIGRDPKIWDNAEEFLPERFLNTSIDIKGHDFELIPFGSGRRVCPAMNFGIATIEIALASLLYAFDWKLPNGIRKDEIDVLEAPGLVLDKKNDLYLVATKYAL